MLEHCFFPAFKLELKHRLFLDLESAGLWTRPSPWLSWASSLLTADIETCQPS